MIALLLSAVVVLIFANGFFVAAEFALVRARRAKVEEMAEAGDRKARLVVAPVSYTHLTLPTICSV